MTTDDDRKQDRLQWLCDQGFDKSHCTEGEEIRVRCSQCQALVVNGVPCHEAGCPNLAAAEQRVSDEGDDRDQNNAVESQSFDNHDWDSDPDWGP